MKHTHTRRDTAACSHTLAKFTKKRLAGKQSITDPLPLIEGRTDSHAHAYALFLLILSHAYTVTTKGSKKSALNYVNLVWEKLFLLWLTILKQTERQHCPFPNRRFARRKKRRQTCDEVHVSWSVSLIDERQRWGAGGMRGGGRKPRQNA